MKLKKRNPLTGEVTHTTEDRESIRKRLEIETTRLADYLISQGQAQHRDEARILIADALESYAVKIEVARIAKNRLQYGHIGFGYPATGSFYKSINYEDSYTQPADAAKVQV